MCTRINKQSSDGTSSLSHAVTSLLQPKKEPLVETHEIQCALNPQFSFVVAVKPRGLLRIRADVDKKLRRRGLPMQIDALVRSGPNIGSLNDAVPFIE